jgi:hypothetical protein
MANNPIPIFMKNAVLAVLLVATLVFGVLYTYQTRKSAQARASAEALQQNVNELQSTTAEQETQAKRLREQLEQTRSDVAAKNLEAAQLQTALRDSLTNQSSRTVTKAAASVQTNSKSSNPLAEIFKNPGMKDMIKNQQKAVLGPMIDKNYSRLFSDLHLTTEQASALKDMILNKQMDAAELGLSMFSSDAESTNRAALVDQIKKSSDAADAQIKDFLGDGNYAQFQSYEKTIAERMVVSGLKDQLAAGSSPLTDTQEQQLVQAMTEERQNFKFTNDFGDKSKFNGDFTTMFTEDRMNTYFQELDKLDQQYQSRAQSILSPDQVTAFSKYLDSQQSLQKAGMQMAVKMFAPAKPNGE